MLVIRMQRTGRKGHAQFRVVVQDSRRTPTSGKIVAQLGSYNPHSKQTILNKEKASFYLQNGAQPSDRVTRLLKAEGIKLPEWVNVASERQRTVRNADKRRSTRPAEEAPAEEPVAETASEPETTEPEVTEGVTTDETPAEEPDTEETATEAVEEPAVEEATAEEPTEEAEETAEEPTETAAE